jgi:hypothetical protein
MPAKRIKSRAMIVTGQVASRAPPTRMGSKLSNKTKNAPIPMTKSNSTIRTAARMDKRRDIVLFPE